jgi:hypothetical protein
MVDGEIRVWTWAVLGPAGKRVWALMFACYYLDADGVPRPDGLMALVAAAAERWQQEKDQAPEAVRKQTVRSGHVSLSSWLPPPPASLPADDVPSSAKLSDDDHALVKAGHWDRCDGRTQEALVLKMAVMQHLAEFCAAPANLVADTLGAVGA